MPLSMLSALLTVAGLFLLAVVLIWPMQRVMIRRHVFRREPLLALLAWQAVSLAAVLSLLAAGPVAVVLMRNTLDRPQHRIVAAIALAVTAYMLVRLGVAGHRVGASLRRTRREHRELLDLVGREFDALEQPRPQRLRVIDHPTPTAYCVPGVRTRVVVSTGMLDRLQKLSLELLWPKLRVWSPLLSVTRGCLLELHLRVYILCGAFRISST